MNKTFSVREIMSNFGSLVIEKGGLSIDQISAILLMSICKTDALGGHWEKCDKCNYIKKHYNSCGNRNCPNCQGVKKEKWILDRTYDLLNVPYFHCVFTIPQELHALFRYNKKSLYALLHRAVRETLMEFGWNPRQKMEAKLGGISILHTWNQQLGYHPHIHTIVPAGGLNKKGEWKTSKGKDDFLFPVKALSSKFKQKLLALIHELYKGGELKLPETLKKSKQYYSLKNELYKKEWVVYAKEAFAGPKQVLEYLARYTHKICIANYRILNITDSHVTFSYLDRKENVKRTKTVLGTTFVKLFIQHVLPKGFTKIRHFGFLSSRSKSKDLKLIRKELKMDPMMPKIKLTTRQIIIQTTGKDPYLCPCCKKGEMVVFKLIPSTRGSPNNPARSFFAKDKKVSL